MAIGLGCAGDDGGTESGSSNSNTATETTLATDTATNTQTNTNTDSDSEGTTPSGTDTATASGTTDMTTQGPDPSTSNPTSDPTTSSTTTTDPTATGTTGTESDSDSDSDSSSSTGVMEPCEPGDMMGMMGDVEKSYLWVANTDQGSISKVDTLSITEVARYRSGPQAGTESPSRTAVSADGRHMVVNNRGTGRVTMIAANEEDCVDKNNNGNIETSQNPNDLLAWDTDECVIWSTVLPVQGGVPSGPRGVTWTFGTWNYDTCAFEDPKVWVGYVPSPNVAAMAKIDGLTGVVDETVQIPNWVQGWNNYPPYGAGLDGDQNVWTTGLRGELIRINAMDNSIDRWTPPGNLQFYGMTVDPQGRPWMGGCSGPVSMFDPEAETFIAVPNTNACHRGVAADTYGNIWVASNGQCGIVQIDADTQTLVQFHTLNPCTTPVGMSIDTEGFLWVVDQWQGAWKIDPQNPNDKTFLPIANQHYTYSDMTGGQIQNVIIQ